MILFNMVSIKSGGGQQNALSFLKNLDELGFKDFLVVCTENTLIYKYCIESKLNFYSVKNTIFSRLKYEFFGILLFKKKICLIFTIFGAAPLLSYNIKKISGCAYSNIFQPEIDIWGYLPFYKKIYKKIVDKIRIFLIQRSDHVILETFFLKEKAEASILKNRRISVVEMAPSKLVTDKLNDVKEVGLDNKAYWDILYLSGAQPNKRIDKFLDIVYYLNKSSCKKFRLKLTLPKNSSYFMDVIQPKIKDLDISDYVINLETIQPESVANVISEVDAIVNVALIESFSNNWVEAWASKRLLIATDADWSRASCQDAALYIDINRSLESAENILSVFKNESFYKEFIKAGERMLDKLPSSSEKTQMYLDIINLELGNKK